MENLIAAYMVLTAVSIMVALRAIFADREERMSEDKQHAQPNEAAVPEPVEIPAPSFTEPGFIADSKSKISDHRARSAAFNQFYSWAKGEAKKMGIPYAATLDRADEYRQARNIFQDSRRWHALRLTTLRRDEQCLRCGATEELQVDHIAPLSRRPDLFDDPDNLQTLCATCNREKGVYAMDYRDASIRQAQPIPFPPSPPKLVPVVVSPEERRRAESRIAQRIAAIDALRDAEELGQFGLIPAGPAGRYRKKRFSYLHEAPMV